MEKFMCRCLQENKNRVLSIKSIYVRIYVKYWRNKNKGEKTMKDIPKFLEEMLLKQYGENIAKRIIDGYQKQRYVTLRVNTIKSSVKEIEDVLIKNNIEFEHINWNENALIIKNVREDRIKEMDIFKDGKITKNPNYEKIDLDENNNIIGLF